MLALRHHILNLSILAPGLILPVLVTALLSAQANGYFYIAYTIAGLAQAIPAAFAIALYATESKGRRAISDRVLLAFRLSLAAGVIANLVTFVGADLLLSIFGASYAAEASGVLRILMLGVFPIIVNSLYIPIARLEGTLLRATLLELAGMAVELTCVTVGGRAAGLNGVAAGWLIGLSLSVIPLVPTVYRVARGSDDRREGMPETLFPEPTA